MLSEKRPKPDGSPESLEARLRALPQPPVPAGLEARLLAAIPAKMPAPRQRRAVRVGVVSAVGAVAAACLLAVLAWPPARDEKPIPTHGTVETVQHVTVPNSATSEAAHQAAPAPTDDSAGLSAWRDARRVLNGAELPPFNWPLQESSPMRATISIPPDLLD